MMKRGFRLTLIAALVFALWSAVRAQQPPAEPQPARPAADSKSQLLQAVGTLEGSHLYQAYLNISLLADARSSGLYDPAASARLLRSVLSLLDTVDRQLDDVSRLDLDRNDRDTLARMREASGMLREQGRELESYWQTGHAHHWTRYRELRDKSWARIAKLLGVQSYE